MSKTESEYQGKAVSPDSVKKTVDFQGIKIRLDRPKGLVMRGTDSKGKPWARAYQYDYGFIPKTLGGDGDGLDVFIGPNKQSTETYWVIQNKEDGSFDEYKVFLGFPDRAAAIKAYKAHIPAKFIGGVASMKLDLVKAMLGIAPEGVKTAMKFASFHDELVQIFGL